MHRGSPGSYITISPAGGEMAQAFLPAALPPAPPLDIDNSLRECLDGALLALGRLDSLTTLLPDPHLFLHTFTRKEAVLSSQIEGTRSTVADLLLYEAGESSGAPGGVAEAWCHTAALEHGIARIRAGFPMSNRLIREVHGVLLLSGHELDAEVPENIRRCMSELERWLRGQPERTSPLIKAALSHVQLDMIHPFPEGNGRVGRLLITLLLCSEGVLAQPLLYLSLYLKQHRDEYYALLDGVRQTGNWEAWLRFFAIGVEQTASGAIKTVQRLVTLFENDRERIATLGRISGSALRLHTALQERPVDSASRLAVRTGLSMPTVNSALQSLVSLGVAREMTGRKRHRVFSYDQYLRILSEGTEPA